MSKKIFPIHTETACQFKWTWSTIFLSRGTTTSCHRCHHWEFDENTISNFHNLPGKLEDRQKMLEGKWPGNGCEYCKRVEESGGVSERQAYINDADLVPKELIADPTAINITPRLLEVYFTNLCNQACIYCTPMFSSTIEHEYNKFGPISANSNYEPPKGVNNEKYPVYLKKFWEWMEVNSGELYEFQVLGGEPLFQDEFEQCLDFFDTHPNEKLTWRIFSNLKHDTTQFKRKINKIKKLIDEKKIKDFQMVCSMDCWGEQAEYVRYGLSLKNWEDNFKILVDTPGIGIHVHMTVTPLTVVTMSDLIEKVKSYRHIKGITLSSNTVVNPSIMNLYSFGKELVPFLQKAINSFTDDSHDQVQKECVEGILHTLVSATPNPSEVKKFREYLDEIDIRRKTEWKKLFPEIDAITSKMTG